MGFVLCASSECCTKEGRFVLLVVSLNSSIVDQLPQFGHFPKYFGELYPHSLHTKLVAAFAILAPF